MTFSRDEVHEIMREVSLSPSAHNSQPALWKYTPSAFYLNFNKERKLPVADPKDHDLILSLGSQIEALDMALKERNKMITQIEETQDGYKIHIAENTKGPSELHQLIAKRKTFRGPYKNKKDLEAKALEVFKDKAKYSLATDKGQIKKIAKLYDQASLDFFRDSNYTKELYSWLRFNKKEKKWFEDGLNQDAMSLSPIESFGASQVLKPKVFKFLDSIGLASPLVSEAPKINTSSFILCLLKNRNDNDHIDLGRFFYRSWLMATAQGYNLCPLSNLVDHPAYKEKLEELLKLPKDLEAFKVFRAGPEPDENKMPGRYRLNVSDTYTFTEES